MSLLLIEIWGGLTPDYFAKDLMNIDILLAEQGVQRTFPAHVTDSEVAQR